MNILEKIAVGVQLQHCSFKSPKLLAVEVTHALIVFFYLKNMIITLEILLVKNLAIDLRQHSCCDQMIDQNDNKLNKLILSNNCCLQVLQFFTLYRRSVFLKGKDCANIAYTHILY